MPMPLPTVVRRSLAAAAVTLAFVAGPAGAQPYPASKITMIVAFAPGGIADTLAVACVGPHEAAEF